ncbi:MAG: HNH endonuclease signature motif containing protein, partial [Candidatus Caldarchaeum sp.]
MSYRQLLEAVRIQYGYRCGYCGVAETEVGALLEIDHYRPLLAGGTDALDNLVYCCPLATGTRATTGARRRLID